MRKVALLALALGSLTTALSADVIDFTPYAGYTTVNMGSVNKAQSQFEGIFGLLASGASFTSTSLSGAWIVGGDLLTKRLIPVDGLSLGLRGEYLGTNQASDDLSEAGTSFDVTESGTLSSFMLGGRYELPGANYGLSLSVGAFAGIGYGAMTQNFTLSEGGESENLNGLYTGTGFVGDLDLRLDWAIPGVQWLHINAQTGYRYASLGDLHNGHGDPLEGADKYLSLIDPQIPHPAVDADFGGLTIGGGLTFDF